MADTENFQQRWENLFNFFDASKNNLIGAGDVPFIEKTLRANGAFSDAQIKGFVDAFTVAIDEMVKAIGGSDKKISRAEWTNESNKLFNKPIADAPVWFKKTVNNVFDAIDTNKNGELNEDEVIALATAAAPGMNITDFIKQQFQPYEGKMNKEATREMVWNWWTKNEGSSGDLALAFAITNYVNKQ